jgi:hypothetical protein
MDKIKTEGTDPGFNVASSNSRMDFLTYVAAGIWAFAIFCGWTVAQMVLADGFLFRLTDINEATLSSISSWLPLASEVARGNLLPAAPALGDGLTELRFYPYITLWIHGLTIAVFGQVGAAVVGEVIWPVIGFLLLISLFRRFLPRRWSITLAALGFLAFLDFPLRIFLGALVGGAGWRDVGTNALPDIASFPVPALTVTLFLGSLLLSLQRRRLNTTRLLLLTAMWSLHSQVHLVNATVGVLFWFSHFPLELARQNKRRSRKWIVAQTAAQAGVAFIVFLPALVGWVEIATGEVNFLGGVVFEANLFGFYYYFAYFLIPLGLTALLFGVMRLDYYELLTRFRPVYCLMLVELLLVTFNLVTGQGIPSENIFSRLGLYVLHPLYYVPVIHFLSRLEFEGPAERYSRGSESIAMSGRLRKGLKWLFMDASIVYLPLFFVVLTAYAGSSAIASYHHAETTGIKNNSASAAAVAVLTQGAKSGDGLAADLPSANLMIPVAGRFGSLWVNRFANNVVPDEIVSRLALYARLAGWSSSDFLYFMTPISLTVNGLIKLDGVAVPKGLGYWLAFHRAGINRSSSRPRYVKSATKAFDAVDLNADACRFGLTRWLAKTPPPKELIVREKRDTADGTIYLLGWDGASASRGQCPKGQ